MLSPSLCIGFCSGARLQPVVLQGDGLAIGQQVDDPPGLGISHHGPVNVAWDRRDLTDVFTFVMVHVCARMCWAVFNKWSVRCSGLGRV